jgi:hypothetical protein
MFARVSCTILVLPLYAWNLKMYSQSESCLYIQVTVPRCKNAVRAKRPPMWYLKPVYTLHYTALVRFFSLFFSLI